MLESEPNPAYTELARASQHEVAIGGALISMVEPHVGHEYAYNRWYEDDHYYAGALMMPWMFAGRRYVATRALQLLRYPKDSLIAQPVTAGCYFHLYWISRNHVRDHTVWTATTNAHLRESGRIFTERTHVYTTFQNHAGSYRRDNTGPRDIHALDYPYGGLVMEVIDAREGHSRTSLHDWLRREYVPWLYRSPASPIAQTVWFESRPVDAVQQAAGARATANVGPGGRPIQSVRVIPNQDRRLTLLHFLDDEPAAHWHARFAGNGARIASAGVGQLQFASPFVPVLHGTDRYVDELR